MNLRFRWDQLKELHNKLMTSSNAEEVVFVQLQDPSKQILRCDVKIKDILMFLWQLSENKTIRISKLIIYNRNQDLIYKYKKVNKCNEEIPDGGNIQLFKNWKTLSSATKDLYIDMTISKINTYDEK